MAQQFGAAIDMLEKVLVACPDELWRVRLGTIRNCPGPPSFGTLFITPSSGSTCIYPGSVEGFMPPAPFTLDELDPAGIIPESFSRDELQTYLAHGREKCRSTLSGLTDEKAQQLCAFPWGELTFAALLLDNMRHVQEHVAQLNMILGQKIGWSPGWITNAGETAV
ncbi:MAG: DinB family protein [Chloroflexi bacterium]|nr:DinB family protein [Chloroflexota bacterium]